MRKILPLMTMLPLLASCGFDPLSGAVATNVAMLGATAVSYSVVGKSPMDYAISQYRGQDCDIRNPKQYEGLYCVNGKYQEIKEPTVYCYRSLGDTDCSDRLDPYNNRNAPIVRNAPYTTASTPAALPNSSAPPIPAPTMLGPAGTTPVARPVATTPSSAAPAPLTQEDMATKGS